MKHLPIYLLAISLMAGCVAVDPNKKPAPATQANTDTDGDCNKLVAGGFGAVVGALLGANTNNSIIMAGIGAGVGSLACAVWNYNSTQTKTAQQSVIDYQKDNGNKPLPAQATLVKFETTLSPSDKASPGGAFNATSYIEVLPGSKDGKLLIEEELTLIKPEGSPITIRKAANEGNAAGAYQTTFSFKLPQGIPQGVYPIKTAVYINGIKTATKDNRLQVVMHASHQTLVASNPSTSNINPVR